jgi:hypothetical protein
VDEEFEISRWLCASFRRVVNLKVGKFTGVKSHDYHVIMKWLLLNMLWGYIHQDVWKMLAELSYFYRQLCAKEIKKEMMEKLEKEIPVLLCKLEKIFPPGWFNRMHHLLISRCFLHRQKTGSTRSHIFSFEMVSQTNNIKNYPSSGPSSKVISLHLAV